MAERLGALSVRGTTEFWGNKMPKCPHCGYDYDIARNDAWSLYDDNNDHEVECPSCDLSYRVRTSAVYSFSTDEQDDA